MLAPSGRLTFQALIRPQERPEPGAVRLHGLDEAALAPAPTFPAVLPALLEHLEGNTLLAYNASFDRLSLQLTAQRHGLELPHLDWACLCTRYEHLRGFRASLRVACRLEGVTVSEDLHRAASDAYLAWELVQALSSAAH